MRTELRLLRLVVPYRGLLALGVITTFLASVLDGFVLVILIPLLKHLFGTAGELRAGSTRLEALVDRLTEPLVAGLSPGQAAGRLVIVLVVGLVLKNVLSYASAQISVGVQEGMVRDLRTRIFDHLLGVDLGYFQRTRAGQLISTIITEVDQTKTVVSASLVSLFQNLVIVATTLVVLSQISLRLTLLTLAFVPVTSPCNQLLDWSGTGVGDGWRIVRSSKPKLDRRLFANTTKDRLDSTDVHFLSL